MKIYNKFLTILAAAALATACVQDLDTLPLNPTDATSESVYGKDEQAYVAGLAKIYFQFVSNDTRDLQVADGGASELIRAFWSTQETTTDEAKCAWGNDAWVRDLNSNTWSEAQNDAVYAVYVRTLQGIAYVNEYLRQTSSDKLSDRGVDAELAARIDGYRAEARFLRAYLYWMAMDTFGDVPFTTEDSPFGGKYNPAQKSRADVFKFCVNELEALASDNSSMPEAKSNYPRADKGSCLGLLARLYLNAEVYTGTAQWTEAKTTCEKIFKLGYKLSPKYSDLFRGDNGENLDARDEMLWTVAYNAEKTQSYGGTSYLTLAAIAADDLKVACYNGVNGGWAGLRTSEEFVSKYFSIDPSEADFSVAGPEAYTCADERGKMFFIKGRTSSMSTNADLYVYLNGWSCFKFNNTPSDQTIEEFKTTAKSKAFSDIDYPMIRLGEIYLIYAEACMHTGSEGEGLKMLKALSDRAGVTGPTAITEDYLIAERARELMWEGHRRTDLIRYKKFHSDDFLWPYKGGSNQGQGFDAHMDIFSIPPTELAANPELKQNPGYLAE